MCTIRVFCLMFLVFCRSLLGEKHSGKTQETDQWLDFGFLRGHRRIEELTRNKIRTMLQYDGHPLHGVFNRVRSTFCDRPVMPTHSIERLKKVFCALQLSGFFLTTTLSRVLFSCCVG